LIFIKSNSFQLRSIHYYNFSRYKEKRESILHREEGKGKDEIASPISHRTEGAEESEMLGEFEIGYEVSRWIGRWLMT
jgi:hypothetical protein